MELLSSILSAAQTIVSIVDTVAGLTGQAGILDTILGGAGL